MMIIPWLVLFHLCLLTVQIFVVQGSKEVIPNDVGTESTDFFTSCGKGWYGFGDMCYKLGEWRENLKLDWTKAQQFCKDNYSGNLATVSSQEIQDFLTTFILLSVQRNVWIGLHDRDGETNFKWVAGDPVNFTHFDPLEHGSFRDDEDCVEMRFISLRPQGKLGIWNDIKCNLEIPFICQKAKGDFNKENVLDPRYCINDFGIGWRFEKSCFFVVKEKKTWSEAEQFCSEHVNGHLTTIDFRVNEYLKYVLRNFTEEMWIGVEIKENTQQKWSSGWLVSFENWMKPEEYKNDTCLSRVEDGPWKIQNCKMPLWFLCENSTETPSVLTPTVGDVHCPEEPKGWRDLGGDLCYYFDIQTQVSWYEANFNCMRRGGTLVSIHSQNESDVLFQFIRYNPDRKENRTFIGLYRHMKYDEEFVWADGSKVDFTNWNLGEPNLEKEQCTELKTDSFWNDILCSDKRGYICSVPKGASDITTTEIPLQSTCSINVYDGISIASLMGVIACVLVFSILIGLVLYHFKLRDRGHDQVKKLTGTKSQPPELNNKKRPRSEMVVTDDADYENVA